MQQGNSRALQGARSGQRIPDQGCTSDAGRPAGKAGEFNRYRGCWNGETVAVIASGPSAQEQDARRLKLACGAVLCVNNALTLCPEADAIYACDHQWWENNKSIHLPFEGLKFTYSEPAAKKYAVCQVPSEDGKGIGVYAMRKGGWSGRGGNGGFQAMNIAYLLGAKRIILYGYDMQRTRGKTHFHGDHKHTSNPSPHMLADWCKAYNHAYNELLALGVEVLNATRDTALECFPRVELEDL